MTKLGDDGVGDQIANELQGDGVDLGFVLRTEDSVSDITYLIIDKAGPSSNLQLPMHGM